MLCISIFYNRQKFETDRPARIIEDLHLAPDYLHSVSERPRQLLGYDVCLKPSDNDWHIPLIEADTTAAGKITVHIPTHVHRLQDKTGMAGMADGDNRHYGCQDNFAGKIHRYNG